MNLQSWHDLKVANKGLPGRASSDQRSAEPPSSLTLIEHQETMK